VCFYSGASNLHEDDLNSFNDVFVRDRVDQRTALVSRDGDGGAANQSSHYPDMTDDGRHVVFLSNASDVIANDANGASLDLYVADRLNRHTRLASHTWQHVQGLGINVGGILFQHHAPAISADARVVALLNGMHDFYPANSGLEAFVRDRGPRYLADIDGAGSVNVTDLLAVIGAWGPCQPAPVPCVADLNGDGSVNVSDLLTIIANWG
jgi:hypothetical protein